MLLGEHWGDHRGVAHKARVFAMLSKIIFVIGCAAALVAAGFWMHFIWSFDWGRFGSRSWGLWFFFAFAMGTLLVAIGVFAVFATILDRFDPDA